MTLLNWLSSVTQSGWNNLSRRDKIRHDPYYRFQSLAEVQLAAKLGVTIDANRATVDDWLRLPGLSINQAHALVELTRSGVALHCLEDMAAVLGMDAARLKPLEPVLQFCYYDSDSVHFIKKVNVNTATIEALTQVPAIDLYLAKTIVAHRSQGRYRNLTHLQRRLSLPTEQVAELMHYLAF